MVCAHTASWKLYDMRCSTEGSTGVDLSDFRNVDRPGACITVDWAIVCSYGALVQLEYFWTLQQSAAIWVG
jgi:hypothetical protein